MKKLFFLLLIALVFGTIYSLSIREEWEKAKATCAKIKTFLQKYGLYQDIVDLLNKGAKTAAQTLCEKKLSSDVCSDIVTVVGKISQKIIKC